ncbi:hypothetical protein ABPG74_016066 [Tetrahymena malaccensis]
MKRILDEDKDLFQKKTLEIQLAKAKKLQVLYLPNYQFSKIPQQVLDMTNLKILDLGFNDIEELPIVIKNFTKLEQLHLNNNPLQYVPIEIKECKNLQILNLANTYVKYLPREFALLKKLYQIDLTGCPLQGNLKFYYEKGIVSLFQYLQRKYDRAVYRELMVKKLKEWVYMGNTVEEIQEVMQAVMDEFKDVDTTALKRLYRNLQNIFNMKLEDVRASEIRNRLFTTLVKNQSTMMQQSQITVGQTLPINHHDLQNTVISQVIDNDSKVI